MLLFISPLLQIIFSVFRIKGRIATPISVIAVFSFLLGLLLSFVSMKIEEVEVISGRGGGSCLDCGLVSLAMLFIGFLIALVLSPIIGLLTYAIFKKIRKDDNNHSI